MKNFPHQINQLPRLNRAVRVFADLISAGENVADDGVVGDALARAGVYTFRGSSHRNVDRLLRTEHRKAVGSQGTRAAARDLRRFFLLLGFINHDPEKRWAVTASGETLLRIQDPAETPRIHSLWREALLDIALEDQQGTSHPYRILLQLVAELPGLPKPYSGLCLEAADDGPAEFSRILAIARTRNPTATMTNVAGEHMARNSTKILPSLAVQLGDIIDSTGRLTLTGRVADALFDPGRAGQPEGAITNLARRPFTPRRRAATGRRRTGNQGITTRRYDPDLIGARFNDHEDCLDRFSHLFPAQTERFEASYDLLLVAEGQVLLVEAKTIRNDERAQIRIAIGQLYYYDFFDIRPLYPHHQIARLLLTDHSLASDVCGFLADCEIGVVWMPPNANMGGSTLGLRQLEQFGI